MQELFLWKRFQVYLQKIGFSAHYFLVIKPEKLIKPFYERLFVKLKQVTYNK